MERGYAKMALDTCLVDQVARNFDARISEVRLYPLHKKTENEAMLTTVDAEFQKQKA